MTTTTTTTTTTTDETETRLFVSSTLGGQSEWQHRKGRQTRRRDRWGAWHVQRGQTEDSPQQWQAAAAVTVEQEDAAVDRSNGRLTTGRGSDGQDKQKQKQTQAQTQAQTAKKKNNKLRQAKPPRREAGRRWWGGGRGRR